MLTIALKNIRLNAPVGMYNQEHILYNDIEVDVQVKVQVPIHEEWPLVDYSVLNEIVQQAAREEAQLLEDIVRRIFQRIKEHYPHAGEMRVAVRKLHPPMAGDLAYAEVSFEI
jgi:dihydroneopterin aldolase